MCQIDRGWKRNLFPSCPLMNVFFGCHWIYLHPELHRRKGKCRVLEEKKRDWWRSCTTICSRSRNAKARAITTTTTTTRVINHNTYRGQTICRLSFFGLVEQWMCLSFLSNSKRLRSIGNILTWPMSIVLCLYRGTCSMLSFFLVCVRLVCLMLVHLRWFFGRPLCVMSIHWIPPVICHPHWSPTVIFHILYRTLLHRLCSHFTTTQEFRWCRKMRMRTSW